MSFRELTIGAYKALHDTIEQSSDESVVPFLAFEYPSKTTDIIYWQQEQDFTREIVNEYNQFAYCIDRLFAWENVLSGYGDDDAHELRFEFTRLPLDHCLHFPYRFRSRIVFCATQLCYTRGIADKHIKREDVSTEAEINFGSLCSVAKLWPEVEVLVGAVRELNAQAFREKTDNYRNEAQHRHGPRLDFGHVADLRRSFPDGALVSYSLGERLPLQTADLLPTLVSEAEKARKAFLAYRGLVEAHCGG